MVTRGEFLPEEARGYERGPQSMIANALDERESILASAAAHLLIHPTKAPLLHVLYAEANPGSRGQGLELALVNGIIDAARSRGCSGVWISKDVEAAIASSDHDAVKSGR